VAFTVYILASRRNGTIYIGHTDDLYRRMVEHRASHFKGFTAKHQVSQLVWFEEHEDRHTAFLQERRMKKWRRLWKLELIERRNPEWRDLFLDMEVTLENAGSPLSRG
jgi:putative endonuclease